MAGHLRKGSFALSQREVNVPAKPGFGQGARPADFHNFPQFVPDSLQASGCCPGNALQAFGTTFSANSLESTLSGTGRSN
jgi:hypothetical protein